MGEKMEPEEAEVEQLRAELAAVETALRNARRELFDCRARLSLIAQVVRDPTRARRAPGVTFGAVLAALHSGAGNVRRPGNRIPPGGMQTP